MNLINNTRNQHFISQAEQRLNASNLSAKPQKQRIYKFKVDNRETSCVSLTNRNGVKICNNLSEQDLFSFDVLDEKKDRYNFEELFSQYESQIITHTNSLVSKLGITNSNIGTEAVEIFKLKIINFLRNPFSVKKVLNTFSSLKDLKPTDELHRADFERVLRGRKPQQKYFCEKIGLSDELYRNWLATIFMTLVNFDESTPNILESVVENMFRDKEIIVCIHIFYFSDETCVLSDRGFTISTPTKDSVSWYFNLCYNAFIRYSFIPLESLDIDKNYPQSTIDSFKNSDNRILGFVEKDNLHELRDFNQGMAYQCHQNIYCSRKKCYGLNVK